MNTGIKLPYNDEIFIDPPSKNIQFSTKKSTKATKRKNSTKITKDDGTASFANACTTDSLAGNPKKPLLEPPINLVTEEEPLNFQEKSIHGTLEEIFKYSKYSFKFQEGSSQESLKELSVYPFRDRKQSNHEPLEQVSKYSFNFQEGSNHESLEDVSEYPILFLNPSYHEPYEQVFIYSFNLQEESCKEKYAGHDG